MFLSTSTLPASSLMDADDPRLATGRDALAVKCREAELYARAGRFIVLHGQHGEHADGVARERRRRCAGSAIAAALFIGTLTAVGLIVLGGLALVGLLLRALLA